MIRNATKEPYRVLADTREAFFAGIEVRLNARSALGAARVRT